MPVTLTLEVRGAQASTLGAAARRSFGPDGGVIGRASNCDWVLPHAKVSARHANVRFADGVFYIEDKSTNGVFVNQTRDRLAKGRPHPLRAGDELFIDPYEIRVSIAGSASARPDDAAWESDPFADPFAPSAPRHGDALGPDLHVSEATGEHRELDPLKLLGGDGPKSVAPEKRRPQARDLEEASPIAAHYKPPAVRRPPPAAPAHEIPEDYDPLADSGISPRPVVETPRRPTPPSPAQAAKPAGQPWDEPLMPLAPASDFASEPPPDEPAVAAPDETGGSVRSLDPLAVLGVDDVTVPPSGAGTAESAVDEPGTTGGTPPDRPAPPPDRAETPPPRATAAPGDLAAVLAGAGLDGVEVTEDLARDFGRILHVVVAGVMDVLRARQQIKDEFRMRMTQFRPADNNPLKFSANVEDALHNLLVKRNAAFLGPVAAFEDAFDDLRGHQLAMLAGMRVAFETMLAEFGPDRLQDQFDRQLKKGALLTVPAKLRYWELYRDHCEALLKDTETAFRRLYGEAFAKAYEAQLNRLKEQRQAKPRGDQGE